MFAMKLPLARQRSWIFYLKNAQNVRAIALFSVANWTHGPFLIKLNK